MTAPIGGGYETHTLQAFAIAATEGASGPTVDLVVVPAAYGDAPADRAENLALAQERTDQVEAARDAVVTAPVTGCTPTLAVLLDRANAMDPANVGRLAHPATDSVRLVVYSAVLLPPFVVFGALFSALFASNSTRIGP